MSDLYEIKGIISKSGVSRKGEHYIINEANIDFRGRSAKIRIPKNMTASVGNLARVELGIKRNYGSSELTAIITEIISGKKGE